MVERCRNSNGQFARCTPLPSEEEMYESYVIRDRPGRSGYEADVEGRGVAEGYMQHILSEIRRDMERNQYFPNIYYINERGNVDLLNVNGKILKSWV